MLRLAALRRFQCRLDEEHGFTIIELLVASLLLLIAGAPITALLLTSSELGTKSLLRSSADELAAAKIELVRGMPYDNIGFPGGNPAGTIASSNQLFYGPTTLNGQTVAISYQISYIDDHGAKTQTYADYKRVVVTITGNGNVLATKTTNVAALTGAAGGGSEYVTLRRLVVDMAAGNPPLANVPVSIANGPSAPRSGTTSSSGSVIFPELAVNPTTSSFYDITASSGGYSTYPGDLPYAGTGSPAVSLEQVNHLTGNDDLQTIHLYANGIATRVNVYKSDGVTPFPASTTVYMGAGLAGNTGTAAVGSPTSTTINQLQLGNRYLAPTVSTISIFPGNYTFSGQSGTAASMSYAAPQTSVAVPNNYPVDLSKTVNLSMYPNPVTSNSTVTVTVKRNGTAIQDAHVELSSIATGVAKAPNVYVWGDTDVNGKVSLIVPQGSGFTIRATDARGSTASVINQTFSTATASATLAVTP